MRILQICAYAAPYGGNFLKSLKALANEVAKENYETIFCFPEVNKKLAWCKQLEAEYKVYYVPLAHARIIPKTYITLKRIFRENPDIVFAHSHFELYDTPLVLTAPKNVKIFWHLHDAVGTYLHGFYKYVWKIHYSWFSKRAILLSVSEKHKRIVIKLGFNPNNAYYEPNAIDTERVKQVSAGRETATDFLIFGWDYYRKGVDLAEKAIEKVIGSATLGIIRSSDVNINKQQKEKVVEMEPSPDINAIFSSTKCFLHISRAEGLSYALMEAIYSGLPVIVSDIEENMVVRDFPTVIMVRNENIDDITSAMCSLLSSGFVLDANKIVESRRRIEETYSIQAWAKRIFNVYKTIVAH